MNLLIIVFTFAVCYGKHTDNSAVYINDQPNKQEITTAKYDTTTIPIEQPAHNNDHDLVKSKQNITDEQMAMMDMITPLPKPHTTTPCTNITVTLNLVSSNHYRYGKNDLSHKYLLNSAYRMAIRLTGKQYTFVV
ncbi:unnamed protein product [Oppiella nova]|uniref:Uncharacterized protein n=1 Tax=Oppiella nova TaxID=334625 RepID=A0A7R9LQA7_9ACAR|nr:unnamed protein product [Oppiella nova]CAG2165847.1 unnamed protein product [Oppiella nova]